MRNPTAIRPFVVSNTGSECWHCCFFVGGWNTNVELVGAPLYSRVWRIQERCLAPQNVHFLKDEIMWECAELVASESLPMCVDMSVLEDVHRLKTLNHRATAADRLEGLYGHWDKIVLSYTAADLTYCENRPIAIAGLKCTFARILDCNPATISAAFGGRERSSSLPGTLVLHNSIIPPCREVVAVPYPAGNGYSRTKEYGCVAPATSQLLLRCRVHV